MKRSRNHPSATNLLSPRETEVLALLANGKSRDDITNMLTIKAVTVRAYLESARDKLNAENIIHAATIAIAKGLIELIEDDYLRIDSSKIDSDKTDSSRSENTATKTNLVIGRNRHGKA